MSFVVNNTTLSRILDLVCPHTCINCGELGSILCERCKKYLITNHQSICPICKQIVAKPTEHVANNTTTKKPNTINQGCPECEMPFWGLWSFGWREDVLEKLVENYKYQSVYAMGNILTDLFDEILPPNLPDITVVPLPTIGRHVRERGLDHTLTIAKALAKRRNWQCEQLLSRASNTVQVGAKMADRKTQASKAYVINKPADPDKHYLLLDDVWTTGSTMLAAEKVLREAGAKQISAVVLAVSKAKQAES